MSERVLKSIALQLWVPGTPDGKPGYWHPSATWGYCPPEVEQEAYNRLRINQNRWPDETWRLVKTYETTEAIE